MERLWGFSAVRRKGLRGKQTGYWKVHRIRRLADLNSLPTLPKPWVILAGPFFGPPFPHFVEYYEDDNMDPEGHAGQLKNKQIKDVNPHF